MLLRKTALMAIVAGAAMVWSPSNATAQSNQDGLNRAAASTAQADAVNGQSHASSQATHDEKPSGIARVFAGLTLPPGIRRLFGADPEPEVQPEPEPEPEVIPTDPDPGAGDCYTLDIVNGMPTYTPCSP